MIEYVFIILAAVFFSVGIIIDNFLVTKKFKNTIALLFYSNITNLLFIPLLWIFGLPKALSLAMIIPVTIVAVAQIIYLYPYFQALKESDTSIITALFNLGKIFVPVIAFILVHERLTLLQYLGFIIILASSFLLTYHGGLRVNKALFYMLLTTLILAIGSTVTKYALDTIDWITVMTWAAVISTIITILVGTVFYRRDIWQSRKPYLKSFWQFMLNEFVTFLAMACVTYAIVKMPVTIAQGLLAISPVLTIALIYAGHRIWPYYFKENLEWKSILKKSAYFILMTIGIILSVS